MPFMMDDDIVLVSGDFRRKGIEFDLHASWRCYVPFREERFYSLTMESRILCTHSDLCQYDVEELWKGRDMGNDGRRIEHARLDMEFSDSEGLHIRLALGGKKAKNEFLRRTFSAMCNPNGIEIYNFVAENADRRKFKME